jgi:hypothetical protein
MDDLVSIELNFVGLRRHKVVVMMIMTSTTAKKVALANEE